MQDEQKELPLTPEQKDAMRDIENVFFREDYISDIVQYAREAKEEFKIPEKFILKAAQNATRSFAEIGHLEKAMNICRSFNVPKESVIDDYIAREVVGKSCEHGDTERIIKMRDFFGVKEEIIFREVESQMCYILSGSIGVNMEPYIKRVHKIKAELDIPNEVVVEAVKKAMIRRLEAGYIDYAIELKEEFDVPTEVVSEAAQKVLLERLSSDHLRGINLAIEIKNKFNISEEFLKTPEAFEVSKQALIHRLNAPYPEFATKIKDTFNLPDELFFKEAEEAIVKNLDEGVYRQAVSIKNIPGLPEQVLKSDRINEAARKRVYFYLYGGDLMSFVQLKTEFDVKVSVQEILKEVPDVADAILKLEEVVPGFKDQVLKSEELLFGLFNFRENPEALINLIKENPFLAKAIENNPRFATKLIMKYPEFDGLSKENITFLFNTKEKILAQNPDMEPNSLDFRQAMQEKLSGYKNNPEILKTIEEKGINLDEWLNYSGVEYFQLGEGENVPFSEVVATPINRINETIDMYAETTVQKLKEYKPELSEFKVPQKDSQETEGKINKMQIELKKAKAEGSDKKVQGIQRSIDGLSKKKEKSISLWNKLVGDINAFKILKEDVSEVNEKLKSAEVSLNKELEKERPVAKEVKQLKEQISELKEELRGKFKVLGGRIDKVRHNLVDSLSPALGTERAQSLYQEIHTELEEQFSHYDTDRSTLSDLFSEKDEQKKDKLEKQPMSISVWSRNPDVDLYQGNYSPCCICIESAHMGAESTIADYNTDLGIQIVNIWDESESKPVTAAWCWLGEDKNGEVVLVVDNVESNTLYSTKYPEQLTKELFDYLQNYAQKIGVKKVVLGKANNDLPTSAKLGEMKNDKEKYTKAGHTVLKYSNPVCYNGRDSYFLEAEDASVKTIWEEESR